MKTNFMSKYEKYDGLVVYFEMQDQYRPFNNQEIKNVLKVLNRPGYLNGIKYIELNINNKHSKQKIIKGIKGINLIKIFNPIDVATLILKQISFYERGVEYGYHLHERYPL